MKNIARIRKIRGWNQEDLAQECGISQSTISKAEKGEGGTSLLVYRAIAEALDTPLHLLFAPEMTTVELRLIRAFQNLSEDRQQGWIDLLDGPLEVQEKQAQ